MKKLSALLVLLMVSLAQGQAPLDQANLSAPLPANLWIELSKITQPAVVGVYLDINIKRTRFRRDPIFDFFEEFFGGGLQYEDPFEEQESTPIGTGFIIDKDGFIVTNYHVIQPVNDPRLNTKLQVQINGQSKRQDVLVIGTDERSDIALLKLKNKVDNLPALQFGDSDKTQVGEYVAAFGNPYGHSNSMTVGIISAKGRSIKELNRFPFIQTDASINPGNSGGPLLNTKGYVIGVNTAVDARAQGIGFAIPANFVKKAVAIFKNGGTIQRGYLGVGLAPIHPVVARQHGLNPHGILVTNVQRGQAAAQAGIKENDVITQINGKNIHNVDSFINSIQDSEPGKTVSLTLMRPQGQKLIEKKLSVTIGNYPNSKGTLAQKIPLTQKPATTAVPDRYKGEPVPQELGFSVVSSSSGARRVFNVPVGTPFGPIVTEVKAGAPADRAGIQVGDVVLQVNNQTINNDEELKAHIRPGVNRFLIHTSEGEKIFSLKAD